MNTLTVNNKIINFKNKNSIYFVFKECEFSLLKIARLAYYKINKDFNFLKDDENIINIPLNIVFKEALNTEILNKPKNTDKTKIRSKLVIESICNCLLPIAGLNSNRFIFKNLDIKLTINKVLFSRLILNLCYQLLTNCKPFCAIEILSYSENEQYIIEFTTEYIEKEETNAELSSLDPILNLLNGHFSYNILHTGESTFKITIPIENTY